MAFALTSRNGRRGTCARRNLTRRRSVSILRLANDDTRSRVPPPSPPLTVGCHDVRPAEWKGAPRANAARGEGVFDLMAAKLRYPTGVRPLLIEEAARRRRVEARFVDALGRAGFAEVVLPIIDYADPYAPFADRNAGRQSYRFVDREGDL